jgi:hypothetical protein
MQNRKNGVFGKRYVRVYYFTVLGKTPCTVKTDPKCLVNGSNKCLDTLSRNSASRDGENGVRKFDRTASARLHKIILTQRNINLNTSHWPNTFRLLRTRDKVDRSRIKEVLIWYARHIGGDYVPVAHCAKTFRTKFSRIEEAMNRMNSVKEKSEDDTPGIVYKKGPDGEYGYYDESLPEW